MSQQKAQLINATQNVTITGDVNISGVTTAGNFIGSFSGTATGLSGTPNLTLGIVTATSYSGDGSNLTGVGSSAFVGQSTTSQSPTTTIDLSLGNVVYFTHDTDTTVAFANTSAVEQVKFVRVKDDTTTARTITWPDSIIWNGGTAPTLIDSSSAEDVQIFNLTTRDQGVTWYGYEAMKNDPAEPIPPYELYVLGGSSETAGLNDAVPRSSPVQIPGNQWESVDSGYQLTAAKKTDGTLWAWGSNSDGGLGVNDRVQRSSPTQIPGTQWSNEFVVNTYGIFAKKSDGTLWTTGNNTDGNLGINQPAAQSRSSPVQVPGTNWQEVTSGFHCTSAVKNDGTLWSWGASGQGTLGLNSATVIRSSPTQVPGTQWAHVTGSYYSRLATKTDGTLWSWGSASRGELGLNDQVIRSSPHQIPGTQWSTTSKRHIASGGSSQSFAIKTDGTLWTFGENALGLNDTVARSSPTQIPGTNWNYIAAGEIFSNTVSATKTDETMWIWGYNTAGRLGLNDTVPRSSPHQIPGTNWNYIAAGGVSIFALKS